MTLTPAITRWLTDQIGTLNHTKKIAASTSTTLYYVRDSDNRGYVLRLYDNDGWNALEPDLCQHEAMALQAVTQIDLPTPRLIAHEPDPSVAGVSLLLMSQLEGTVVLKSDNMDDYLQQAAHALAKIHHAPITDFAWHFKRYKPPNKLIIPTWTKQNMIWEQIITTVRQSVPPSPTIFIHRDYHMANYLWQDGKLSGVVDWINACLGPAGMDVGHIRVNLAELHGVAIADKFLDAYQCANPDFVYHPYWDMVAVCDVYLYDDNPPIVYQPWVEYGITDLTDALILKRAEAYVASLLNR
ncbi:MAG: aminoglycoside phosphotransferase family protein [Chloroflexota bacterium]